MTLDEAISHCEEVAKNNQWKIDYYAASESPFEKSIASEYKKCCEEYGQIAEWLKLLKRILDSGDCNDCAMLYRQCRYAPGWGEQVRYNCPFYSRESEE